MDKELQPLVSVVTPCLNGGKHLKEYFDSILFQEYDNIEFYFVNDGSTDETERIAIEYEKKFQERKIKYKHIYIDNSGQAKAINQVLSMIEGEYLIWPDADDILLKDNFSKKVSYLEKNRNVDLVITQTACINESGEKITNQIFKRKHNDKFDIPFWDYIYEKNVVFPPGIFMARVSALKKKLNNMQIVEARGGQNWQFILPLTYNSLCGYIDEVTYLYRISENSHSRSAKSYEQQLERTFEHENILCKVVHSIKNISLSDINKAESIIELKYIRKRMYIYMSFLHYIKGIMCFIQLIKLHNATVQDCKMLIKCFVKSFGRLILGVKPQ